MSKYVLLTGATGLVGRYLLKDLLLQGHRVAVLARAGRKDSAATRIETIMQVWERQLGRELPRPVCLEGDVASESLGLSLEDQNWVARYCDRMLHNAAVLTFHGPDRNDEPWVTNCQGTRHVLEFCRETNIRDLHYVSTAYVCGDRTDMVHEDEFNVGQGFKNDYEHSKFLAEQMVREADWFDHKTIYRPAVIAGDSRTGYTSTYHGLYLYLRLMSLVVANTQPDENGIRPVKMRSNLKGDELRNIVPVDWVSAVICRLFETREARDGTYHLSPIEPITPREACLAASEFYRSTPVEFCGEQPPTTGMNEVERFAYENIGIYESYETTDPRFDTTNLLKFTSDLPCPRIDVPMVHRFLQYGEEDRWGKRREPKPRLAMWVDEHLAKLVASVLPSSAAESATAGDDQHEIGLDVTGPGGGQWTLTLSGRRLLRYEPGLSQSATIVLRMPISEFAQLAKGDGQATRLKSFLHVVGRKANGELSEPLASALFPSVAVTGDLLPNSGS